LQIKVLYGENLENIKQRKEKIKRRLYGENPVK
jgi:hypothetical protein